MQFQVPQFIDVEDTIFGPLTFKQFIYIAGGAGIALIAWKVLPFFIAAPLMGIAVALGIALAFIKHNERPLIVIIEHAFYYLLGSKLYLWDNARKKQSAVKQSAEPVDTTQAMNIPKLSESKLHELAWSLDIKERVGESEANAADTTISN